MIFFRLSRLPVLYYRIGIKVFVDQVIWKYNFLPSYRTLPSLTDLTLTTSEIMDNKKLQFVPFMSTISPGFWYKLVDLKLNSFKLDDSAKIIHGFYSSSNSIKLDGPCRHTLEYDAFDKSVTIKLPHYFTEGRLINTNTIEKFKTIDKMELILGIGKQIWDNIVSGKAIENPSLMFRFIFLTFADLKKYNFCYWFGYPTFIQSIATINEQCLLSNFDKNRYTNSFDAEYVKSKKIVTMGYFLIVLKEDNGVTFHALNEFHNLFNSNFKLCFGLIDPSGMEQHPGWLLRNFLTLISIHWAAKLNNKVQIFCIRQQHELGKLTLKQTLCLNLHCQSTTNVKECPKVTGWEKNSQNKLAPKFVNLAESMNPEKLAESTTSLNLKLLKWRLLPDIDLDKIMKLKCLLFGAGTLGCNVSRALLGWGVRHITFVDNGTVSFSNPVRQTLYEFSDCKVTGGAFKAKAAAEKLQKIFPGVISEGFCLNIPMPGHPVNSSEKYMNQTKQEVIKIIQLIKEHDVIFLLTDSRESRWVPTVIAGAESKLVINAALGFDSYLVMRHGVSKMSDTACKQNAKLGCYFCNDVVAPGNSLRDRTLDQQCTVSRPGLSFIASALAVELCVSVVQHPDQSHYIPENINHTQEEYEFDRKKFLLGPIPHQIRGFLTQYNTLLPTTFAFSKCTACSENVLNLYRNKQIDFLMEVFNSPANYLEDVTGLTELHKQTALAENDILEFSDSESV